MGFGSFRLRLGKVAFPYDLDVCTDVSISFQASACSALRCPPLEPPRVLPRLGIGRQTALQMAWWEEHRPAHGRGHGPDG
jgi:hypothetical protein